MWILYLFIIFGVGFIITAIAAALCSSSFKNQIKKYATVNNYQIWYNGQVPLYLYRKNQTGINIVYQVEIFSGKFEIKNVPDLVPAKTICCGIDKLLCLFIREENVESFSIVKIDLHNINYSIVKLPYKKLLGIELSKNGKVIYSKEASRTIGGALVGGALLGTAGAVVGGTSGDVTAKEVVDSYVLKILLDDVSKPIMTLNTPIEQNAMDIKGMIEVVINRNVQSREDLKHEELKNAIKQGAPSTITYPDGKDTTDLKGSQSAADELQKFAKLLKDGVITEEEFKQQKQKLLNL